jgi:hypothetical protein
VLTEQSFLEVLQELDTITDAVDYLGAKERLVDRCGMIVHGSESNLVAWYIHQGREFPEEPGFLIIQDDIWAAIRDKPEFKRRKEADQHSYTWDRLIEELSDPNATLLCEMGIELSSYDLALRTMARENRFARRLLGRGFYEFLAQAMKGTLRSRILSGQSGVIYVVALFKAGEDDKYRIAELGTRCLIARHRVGEGNVVVGVGICQYEPGSGSKSDLIYVDVAHWSPDDDARAREMAEDLGFFSNTELRRTHEDEYPDA